MVPFPKPIAIQVPCRAISPQGDGKHYFFGYYDKCPWDASGRYLLGLQTDFMDRLQSGPDAATVGVIDLQQGNAWRPLALSLGWSWQQGAMLQWAPWAAGREILYNDREGERFVCRVRDVSTGAVRTLPLPISSPVSPDGRWVLSTNFPRRYTIRAGYGYAGLPDPFSSQLAPEEDGIWIMDPRSGEHHLVVSTAQMARLDPVPEALQARHWFDLEGFAPDSQRLLFFHRWMASGRWWTRVYTVGIDGQKLCRCVGLENLSHFCWKNPRQYLIWATRPGVGDRYYLVTDGEERQEAVGEGVLTVDGHCTYSPDGRWILTDTYPDKERMRTLILFRPETGQRINIGKFYSPPLSNIELRCDLHPRWNRDGTQVCIDSVHEGSRALYVLDVTEVVNGY